MEDRKAWSIVAIFLAVLTATVLTDGFGMFGAGPPMSGAAVGVGDDFRIPLPEISEKAKFYEYQSGTTLIRFFAVNADDGSIKTGFDECDICYRSGKGYSQEGEYMVCNNCGNRYPINGLGTENKDPGGCWPGYLPSTVQGGDLVIKRTDIESGAWRF